MEREFGISCPSGLPKEPYQDDMLDAEKRESAALRNALQSHHEELQRAQSHMSQVEEEKKVGDI